MDLPIANQPPAYHPAPVKLARIWHRRIREPLLTVLLAIQIFSLFIMPPLRGIGLPIPHIAVYIVLLIFVGVAIFASRSRGAMLTMIFSVGLTILGIIWRQDQPDFDADFVSALGQVLTQLSLLWVVSTAVFGPGRTTYHRVLGAVVMYLAVGMIFTSLDIFLARTVATAFTHLPADNFGMRESLTYFSFSTLTTSSFGDITPVHPVARSLANLEAVCGQLFPATLLARIVGLHNRNLGKGD